MKIVRSDNGYEFTSKPMKKFYREKGIIRQTMCVDTPQQNSRVEKKNRHILNVAKALRFQAHLPLEFWGECVLTAAYLINRTPTAILNWNTPYEVLFNYKPSYEHLRIFGSLCYADNIQRPKDKFCARSRRCVFIGYLFGKKRWTVYDLETGDIFVRSDVIFHERIYPYEQQAKAADDSFQPGEQRA